jgi:hypothetical protein
VVYLNTGEPLVFLIKNIKIKGLKKDMKAYMVLNMITLMITSNYKLNGIANNTQKEKKTLLNIIKALSEKVY